MRIADMRQFPVEHGGEARRCRHDIAQPQIAMDQRGRCGFGQMVFEPADRRRDDRPVATIITETLF